jgi:hypothetical protein
MAILLVRRAVRDVAPDHDDAGSIRGDGAGDCQVDRPEVVGIVDPLGVPAEGTEPGLDVFAECKMGWAVELSPVVVIQDDEPIQPEVPGKAGSLR